MSAQAGWFRDPSVPGQLRYFDGTAWTEHVQPDPTAVNVQQYAPPPMATPAPVYGAPVQMPQQYQQVQQVQINQINMGKQEEKSVALALVLTWFFGPFGMFYSTILGGVVMLIADVILGTLTFGLFLIIAWPVQMVWAAIAASNANKASMPAVAVTGAATPMATPQYAPQPQAPMAQGPVPAAPTAPPPALPQSTGYDPFANGQPPTHELPQAQPPSGGNWYR